MVEPDTTCGDNVARILFRYINLSNPPALATGFVYYAAGKAASRKLYHGFKVEEGDKDVYFDGFRDYDGKGPCPTLFGAPITEQTAKAIAKTVFTTFDQDIVVTLTHIGLPCVEKVPRADVFTSLDQVPQTVKTWNRWIGNTHPHDARPHRRHTLLPPQSGRPLTLSNTLTV